MLLWRGTPWPRTCRAAQPSLNDGSQPMELVESSVVEPESLKVSMVGAVELSSQEKLRQHVITRLIHCLECKREEEFLDQGEVCVRECLKGPATCRGLYGFWCHTEHLHPQQNVAAQDFGCVAGGPLNWLSIGAHRLHFGCVQSASPY